MYPIAPTPKGRLSGPKHRGATAVTAVFLTVAGVVLGLGIAGAVAAGLYAYRHLGDSVGRSIAYALAVALSGVFLASVLAFFGHVLDLLTEIAENTHAEVVGIDHVGAVVEALEPTSAAPASSAPAT